MSRPPWQASELPVLRNDRPLVMAHRGRSAFTPESTFQAFQEAHALGVDFLETDAHLTKDGEVVLFHDTTLDRTTNGTGRLVDYTLTELEQFDMGYWFQPPALAGTDEYPHRGAGMRVQTLGAILDAFPDVRVNVDLKDKFPALPARAAEVLSAHDAVERVIVGSFRQKQIKRFRTLSPAVTSAGPFEVLKFYLGCKFGRLSTKSRPFHALQVPVHVGPLHLVTPKTIRQAHARGIAVQPWVINDPAQMRTLLAWGVDGLFTDDPETLLGEVTRFMNVREEPSLEDEDTTD